MFGKHERKATQIASLIGAGTTVTGDLTFSGGLRIDGTVKGAVRCGDSDKGGMLVISESGNVEGEVRVGHLVVAGRITGPVRASELAELQPKAKIVGDLRYRALEMHNGAVIEGQLVHESLESPAQGGGLKLAAVTPKLESTPDGKTKSMGG
jgi:cytoskeletal protein CcmA (bactofilin family)